VFAGQQETFMSWLQAIILSIIQGVTELFPVSSLGHAVVIPDLLDWPAVQGSESFLPFLVVMHLGTAVALLIYFWRDWYDFAMAVLFNRGPRPQEERRLFWRVALATLPAVLVAIVAEKAIRDLFAAPLIASVFLIVNGAMLFTAERIKPANPHKPIDQLTWLDAVKIGVLQSLALIPGMSRSGATMVGGYLCGLKHEDAARFSFLTGTPIILAATVHELPKMLKLEKAAHAPGAAPSALPHISLAMSAVSGLVAGLVAYAAIWALMRWFKTHEVKGFDPFAWYCLGFGALATVINIVAP
jgi:undecaprenyl-diphosphatase